MTTSHDIELELDGGRLLKTTVEALWSYERNPGDKEIPHYHGEDDGWCREDERYVEPITIDGVETKLKDLSKEDSNALEDYIDNLSPDDT